jgi:hypothetical protein
MVGGTALLGEALGASKVAFANAFCDTEKREVCHV